MAPLSFRNKTLVLAAALAALLLAGGTAWRQWTAAHRNDGLAGGNGRIEATEVDVATKYAGRVAEILVREGDFVRTHSKDSAGSGRESPCKTSRS